MGLYLVFPVFYANVSPAWRLERKARVVVDLAGMYFQLLMTIPVSLLFLLTGEQLWLLLFVQLDAMILFSLNPFLRFDGYWLCSDFLGVPNLRSRSQLLAKTLCNRLIGKPSAQETPLLRIRPMARLGLACYALGTYLFGGVVIVFLCRVLPSRIQALPSEFMRLLGDVATDGSQGHVTHAVADLLQIAFVCLMVVAAGRMLAQLTPPAARAGRHLFRKIAVLYRKDPEG
jgi:putative peptide zinc metalloprotease protein